RSGDAAARAGPPPRRAARLPGAPGGAPDDPAAPDPRALSHATPGLRLGRRTRRSGAARARRVGRADRADGQRVGAAAIRSARRSHPHGGWRHRGSGARRARRGARRHEARAAAGGDAGCRASALLRRAGAHPRSPAHGERAPAVQRPHDHRAGTLRGPARGGAGAGAALVVSGDRLVSRRSSVCLGLLLAAPATQTGAQVRAAAPSISDNSFLIEEAYNQEPGVVQHISAFQLFRGADAWAYSFTEEWPLFGRTHQLSFTVPIERLHNGSSVATGL